MRARGVSSRGLSFAKSSAHYLCGTGFNYVTGEALLSMARGALASGYLDLRSQLLSGLFSFFLVLVFWFWLNLGIGAAEPPAGF